MAGYRAASEQVLGVIAGGCPDMPPADRIHASRGGSETSAVRSSGIGTLLAHRSEMLRTVRDVRRGVSIAAMLGAAEFVRRVGRRGPAAAPTRRAGRDAAPAGGADPAAVVPICSLDAPMNRGGAIPDDPCDDLVDDASQQSFPASDPPSFTRR